MRFLRSICWICAFLGMLHVSIPARSQDGDKNTQTPSSVPAQPQTGAASPVPAQPALKPASSQLPPSLRRPTYRRRRRKSQSRRNRIIRRFCWRARLSVRPRALGFLSTRSRGRWFACEPARIMPDGPYVRSEGGRRHSGREPRRQPLHCRHLEQSKRVNPPPWPQPERYLAIAGRTGMAKSSARRPGECRRCLVALHRRNEPG